MVNDCCTLLFNIYQLCCYSASVLEEPLKRFLFQSIYSKNIKKVINVHVVLTLYTADCPCLSSKKRKYYKKCAVWPLKRCLINWQVGIVNTVLCKGSMNIIDLGLRKILLIQLLVSSAGVNTDLSRDPRAWQHDSNVPFFPTSHIITPLTACANSSIDISDRFSLTAVTS